MGVAKHQALFANIPSKDHLLNDGQPDKDKILDFLKFKKEDVAMATGLKKNSIRYEPNRIPIELIDRLREWAIAINLVASYFKEQEKTMLWFGTTNPLLGNMSPRDMIRLGRFKKLFTFIQNALDENVK